MQGGLNVRAGGDLLSRLVGSIIGADGLNDSVRNGKRWNPVAITAVMSRLFDFLNVHSLLLSVQRRTAYGGHTDKPQNN